MFKKLPGDEARTLVTTTPDTAVVFRPAVVRTPAIFTVTIFLWRLLAGIVRLIWRHPVAVAVLAVPAVLSILYGWRIALVAVAVPVSLLAPWPFFDRASFDRWMGWRLLAWWRLVWIYRRHWQSVMIVSGLGRHLQGRDYLPHIIRVTCTSWADLVTVKMISGQSVKDWADRIEHLAHGFGTTSCRVTVARSGRLLLTFPRRDPLATPLPALPIPETPSVGPVEIGRCEDGTPWRLKVHGTHVLVAGATGAGKGSIIWSTIRGLLPAVRAGLVQVWALDPKRMELSFGRDLFGTRYAASPADCADLLEAAVSVMQERADRFAGLQRSHTPTVDDPFVLVVVDEVAFLTAYQSDKGLKLRISAALATLTTQGRAVGFGVMAALQDPRKEVMNVRNLFPDKIALRLDESEQVDMVLGDGARDRGALADHISPVPERGAGIGYVRLETSPDPIRARAGYVSDSDIRAMVADFAEEANK
ncbi:S-DNA-T family DNA segregation ATPase FtsK/SpoIIIE [Streptosporangium becharense]|uniref:S-DNA-T family DNA segregation ATPase FtsK/SpoIIIE n=1 Tax=Streptosporangium becharense TaxID=1816182 RepID=A0A7W9IFN7_9ACTN|nr:FtsK/SpoIIIE domain-containing protein [Streptosporangium becharense]MBB2909352.1 S-DNA-T family DNA segregation ATPase FtsK/SpoIIIE [Streptosporangium becharense]MBB5819691.1 S-DNA-T family DNA segregation ATPase FtsK/SpoIIIE [Streptosporangium becharense]